MNRRTFLQAAAGVGAMGFLPAYGNAAMQAAGAAASYTVPARLIPGTKESLPVIGFGSTKAVREIPAKGPAVVADVIKTMVDHGARVVDTSIRPVNLDEPFGKILQDPRWTKQLFVAQKINSTEGKQVGLQQVEQTERLFNRKPADLIQVESMRNADVHLQTLKELKAAGRTRYIGVTSNDTGDFDRVEHYMKTGGIDFVQVMYSIAEPDAEQRLLPLAKDMGIAVLIRSPFQGGDWFSITSGKPLPGWAADIECTSWAQACLKFILANQAVTSILTETTNPKHMDENMRSSLGKMPDAALLIRMKADVKAMA
jgi:diketogulonate reductase-like aldo/keto reductase